MGLPILDRQMLQAAGKHNPENGRRHAGDQRRMDKEEAPEPERELPAEKFRRLAEGQWAKTWTPPQGLRGTTQEEREERAKRERVREAQKWAKEEAESKERSERRERAKMGNSGGLDALYKALRNHYKGRKRELPYIIKQKGDTSSDGK